MRTFNRMVEKVSGNNADGVLSNIVCPRIFITVCGGMLTGPIPTLKIKETKSSKILMKKGRQSHAQSPFLFGTLMRVHMVCTLSHVE